MGNLPLYRRNSITHNDELCQRYGQETDIFTTTDHIAPDVGMKSMNRIRWFCLCFECSVAACYVVNQLSSNRSLVRLEAHSSKLGIIDAVCINCNKRFKSIRAVSMHLRITGTRHAVNIINHGYYDKKTGLREINRWVLSQSSNFNSRQEFFMT